MNLTIAPRGILQIDDAKIIYRNFSGAESKFNRAGDRNFAVIIDDRGLAEDLKNEGWNIKIRPPRDEFDEPFMYLPVKVKFSDRGPDVYLVTNNKINRLDEDTICCLDNVDIMSVDLDIRPYDWEINGKEGRTAYLKAIKVVQNVDRFAAEFIDAYEE